LVGGVKDKDVREYPPFGVIHQPVLMNRLGQRLVPGRSRQLPQNIRANQFNSRAKNGFQYWYKEPTSNISRE